MLIYKNYKLVKSFLFNTNLVPHCHFIRSNCFKSGDLIKVTVKINQSDVDNFSNLTKDHNPIHKNAENILEPIVQGAFLNGVVSGLIGTKFPGPGSIVLSQKFSFPNKCLVNRDIEINITLLEARKIMKILYECRQDGTIVFEGEAKIIQKKII